MPSISIHYFVLPKAAEESFVLDRNWPSLTEATIFYLSVYFSISFIRRRSYTEKGKSLRYYMERGTLSGHATVPHYHSGRLDSGWKLESILWFFIAFVRNWHEFPRFSFFHRAYTADQIVPLKIINVHEERELGFSFNQRSPTIGQSGYLHARDRPFAMQIRLPCVS